MKVFNKHQMLQKVICNRCERELTVENGMIKEGVYEGEQSFGYFSNKDGKTHHFDLCEKCYDEWIGMFRIPITETEITEYL